MPPLEPTGTGLGLVVVFGRMIIIAALMLTGCAKIHRAGGIALVNEAQSLAAEWALVNSQLERGQVSTLYAAMQRKSAREQLQSVEEQVDPASAEAVEVRALLNLPEGAPAAVLRAHSDRLDHIANSLDAA